MINHFFGSVVYACWDLSILLHSIVVAIPHFDDQRTQLFIIYLLLIQYAQLLVIFVLNSFIKGVKHYACLLGAQNNGSRLGKTGE